MNLKGRISFPLKQNILSEPKLILLQLSDLAFFQN